MFVSGMILHIYFISGMEIIWFWP